MNQILIIVSIIAFCSSLLCHSRPLLLSIRILYSTKGRLGCVPNLYCFFMLRLEVACLPIDSSFFPSKKDTLLLFYYFLSCIFFGKEVIATRENINGLTKSYNGIIAQAVKEMDGINIVTLQLAVLSLHLLLKESMKGLSEKQKQRLKRLNQSRTCSCSLPAIVIITSTTLYQNISSSSMAVTP